MLVLSRKPGERIVMPSLELALTVISVEGNRVRLGIAAPTTIAVLREEIAQLKTKSLPGPAPAG
jgi:carbon storage regulator CsrA